MKMIALVFYFNRLSKRLATVNYLVFSQYPYFRKCTGQNSLTISRLKIFWWGTNSRHADERAEGRGCLHCDVMKRGLLLAVVDRFSVPSSLVPRI